MAETDLAFTGAVPEFYDRYMGPMLFEPFARNLARRFTGFTGDILETAAGTGRLTRALAEAAPQARITATDLNAPMLERAAEAVAAPGVVWRPADALALPFAAGNFDAVVCQFGVMFFPDKVKGFAEALRVLKPGGRFMFSVWGPLEANTITRVLQDALGGASGDAGFMARTPFGYHDPEVLRGHLAAAGFDRVNFETVTLSTPAASARDAALGLCLGSPLRAELEARGPGGADAAVATVTEALTEAFGVGPFAGTGQALVVTAAAS